MPLTWEAAVVLLDTIPGVDRSVAEVMVAEMGPDDNRLATSYQLAWTGLAPSIHQGGGTRYSGHAPKWNRSLSSIMV